jgi:hypothetical protein
MAVLLERPDLRAVEEEGEEKSVAETIAGELDTFEHVILLGAYRSRLCPMCATLTVFGNG